MKKTVVFLLAFVALTALPQAATTISGRVEKIISRTTVCVSAPCALGCGHCGVFQTIITYGPVPGAKIYLLSSSTASGPYLKVDSAVTTSSGQYSFNIPLTGAGLYQVSSPRQTIGDMGYYEVVKSPAIVNQNDALTQDFILTVEFVLPSGLSYSKNPAVYGINAPITPNNPTLKGSGPLSFSVTPALPAGLTLSVTTGMISGTPTTLQAAANYIVTANNAYGTTSASVNISLIVGPTGLYYSANPVEYIVGTVIAPNTPNVTGAVTSYAVTPALPQGLTMNGVTGVISGTPSTPKAATNYIVTATNTQGAATTATLLIWVASPVKIFQMSDARIFTLKISGTSAMVFSLPGNAEVERVEILDTKGLKVWESAPELGNGENFAVWNGKTKGQSISRGLYFARITLMDAKQNPARTLVQRVVYSP